MSSIKSRNLTLVPAWLWAPCALYAISAACILVGISRIIAPIYDGKHIEMQMQMQKFYCLIALNLYEAALLAVALLILLWRRVYDDAIAVTLLIAIFLIASAVALDTVAPAFPLPVLLFGLAGLLAACGKLVTLHLLITGRFTRMMLLGLVLLLAVNFLLPGALGYISAGRTTNLDLILPWRLGWYASIAAGAVLIVAAMRLPTGAAGGEIGQPFLRTGAMRWLVVTILFAGAAAHHYALTWAFNIPIALIELAPAAGILALIALELLRGYGYRLAAIDAAVCLSPLAITAAAAMLLHEPLARPIAFGTPSDPAIFLAAFAAAVSINAWRREQPGLHHVAALYLVAAVVLVGVDPRLLLSAKVQSLNWNIAGFMLGAAMALLAAVQRDGRVAVAAGLILAISTATSPWAFEVAAQYRFNQIALAVLVFTAAVQIIYVAIQTPVMARVALVASVGLAGAVLYLFSPDLWPALKGPAAAALDYPILSGTITLAFTGLVALCTRDWRIVLPGAAPISVALASAKEHQGWGLVVLSFIVLAIAAGASIRKNPPTEEVALEG